jgi:hypothetical protein
VPRFPTRAALALLGALALGGCARHAAVDPADGAIALPTARPTVIAENGGGEWLDVYLLHERGELYLGRLAPGARTELPLSVALRGGVVGMVRLAVLPGAARTTQPSRDPRTVVSMAQPVLAVMGQRWTFAQGQLTGRVPHPR